MFDSSRRVVVVVALLGGLSAHAELVDRVAAVVNTDVITLSEVEARAMPEVSRLRESDPAARLAARSAIIKRALDSLIGEKLMEAQIKELGIEVTDSEVEQSIDLVMKQNNMNGDGFEAALLQEGYTMPVYKTFLRRQLARMKLVNLKVRSKVKLSDEDLKAEYAKFAHDEAQDAEVRTRHILVQLAPKATPEQVEAARLKAAAIAAEARLPNADFAELARKRSEGPSAADGGDLGYFRRGVMDVAFEKASFSLPVNGVSEPVRTKLGWHVIKVVDRRALAAASFDEVKEQLGKRMFDAQLDRYTEQYVQELRAAALVEVKL